MTKEYKHTTTSNLLHAILLFSFFSIVLVSLETILSLFTQSSLPIYRICVPLSLLGGLLLTLITALWTKPKTRMTFGGIALLVIGLLFTVETALFRSFGYFYPIITVFSMSSGIIGSFGSNVINTVMEAVPYMIIFFSPVILFFVLRRHLVSSRKNQQRLTSKICIMLASLLGVSFLANQFLNATTRSLYGDTNDFNHNVTQFGMIGALGIDSGIFTVQTEKNTNITPPILPQPMEEKIYTSEKYNISNHIEKLLQAENPPKDIQELNRYVLNSTPSEKNNKSGIFKGKNLIFICAESLSPYAISEEYTPTLYKLTTEGITFTNYYSPTYGESTSGGEYALLLSQIPQRAKGEKGMSMRLAADTSLSYSLPALFLKNGYICNGYHNNSYTYYDRHITHPAMGLNWYGCGGCKTVDSHAPEYDISTSLSPGWPRSDTELFQCTVSRYILPGIEKNSPFFTYYLTVSGHSNYSFTGNCISRKNRQYVESSHASNTVKAYLSAQKELDFALEFLLNELKENDNLEETVIVIANDHHPYGLAPTWAGNDNTDYLSELYGKKAISLADKEKGVFIIYNTKQTPENVTVPVCSFDVMPTLLNMFGIEFDSRLLCGKDAFTPGERLIPFSDGSFVSEKGYFNPRTHNIGDQNYVDEIKNKILLQKRYSLSARKNGYFSYLSR